MVTCIGGGPGTDIFAIIAAAEWLFDDHQPSFFRFHIFDSAAMEWKQTLDKLLVNSPHPSFDYSYNQLRLSNRDSERFLENLKKRIKSSNIITMLRFVSEIERQDNDIRAISMGTLYEALLSAQPGTIALVADHEYEGIQSCINEIIDKNDWSKSYILPATVGTITRSVIMN